MDMGYRACRLSGLARLMALACSWPNPTSKASTSVMSNDQSVSRLVASRART